MIVNCPHCAKQLKLSDKVQVSLQQLEPGRKLKVKCVHCEQPFALDGSAAGGAGSAQVESAGPAGPAGKTAAGSTRVRPPAPPSVDWLQDGSLAGKEIVEDVPRSLVLMPQMAYHETVIKAAVDCGYLVDLADNPDEAIEMMRFVNYSAVFLHSRFEEGGIQSGTFHRYMCQMAMARRRYIFYALIGDQFKTLYDLQALASSANVVVNETEIPYIGTVLKKVIPEYESLFGPLMEELRLAGK